MERRAVIDIGSNSVLLAILERTQSGWSQIFESSSITSLGEGTKTTGLMAEDRMRATLEALKQFFQIAREHSAEVVAAATMAARIARNTTEFRALADQQETPFIVLSGEEEAELGFRAVANDPIFAQSTRLSIIDPGGHSTELTTADRTDAGWTIGYKRSFAIGTLAIKSSHLPNERTEPLDLLRACAKIDDEIGLTYRPGQGGDAVVLGATGTNLISIREQMTHWQPERVHGAWLDYEEISKAVGWMMPMSDDERAAIHGMEPGRQKTVHLGALILERFLQALRLEGCRVSVRGWRHAIAEDDAWFGKLIQAR